jgi:hypothetical protein
MKHILTAILMLAVSLSTLAGAPKSKAPATGTIIVYRPGEWAGAARTYAFNIDNGSRYHIKNGCYMQFTVPIGDHTISHGFDITLNFGIDNQKVHVNPGQTVYFQYIIHPFMGMIFEVSEDQVEAKQTTSKLRLQTY